ncbi:Acetophenone carboxylase delta subunit [compost metagenome]
MSYQIELFHNLLNEFLRGDSALLTTDGDILAVRGIDPVCCGTLTTAASTVIKYLKLQEGDVVLLNDPYSGGSVLSSFTFVTALSEDLLWAKTLHQQKQWTMVKSLEEEGLRIPPTPIRQNGKLNEMILSAMQGHPACPPQFVDWLKEQCVSISKDCQRFLHTAETIDLDITGDLIKEYFNLCKQVAMHKITEAAPGDARVEVYLDGGDMIRLKMEVSDGHLNLDFSGTTTSKTVNLTDSATYGTCFHWLANYYGFLDFANTGTFSVVHVTKPAGCLLQSKYPAPTMKGMSDGVAALQMALQLAMSQIHSKREMAPSSVSPLRLQIKKDSHQLSLALPGGKGAAITREGKSACGLCETMSVERLEREFPLVVQRLDYRTDSGGKGKFNGGKGLTLKFAAMEDVEITWMSDLNVHKPRISKNCTHGDNNEVSLQTSEGLKQLPPQGHLKLKAGDIPTFSSGSGGGWGKQS